MCQRLGTTLTIWKMARWCWEWLSNSPKLTQLVKVRTGDSKAVLTSSKTCALNHHCTLTLTSWWTFPEVLRTLIAVVLAAAALRIRVLSSPYTTLRVIREEAEAPGRHRGLSKAPKQQVMASCPWVLTHEAAPSARSATSTCSSGTSSSVVSLAPPWSTTGRWYSSTSSSPPYLLLSSESSIKTSLQKHSWRCLSYTRAARTPRWGAQQVEGGGLCFSLTSDSSLEGWEKPLSWAWGLLHPGSHTVPLTSLRNSTPLSQPSSHLLLRVMGQRTRPGHFSS